LVSNTVEWERFGSRFTSKKIQHNLYPLNVLETIDKNSLRGGSNIIESSRLASPDTTG
jgi:hypothetical protein